MTDRDVEAAYEKYREERAEGTRLPDHRAWHRFEVLAEAESIDGVVDEVSITESALRTWSAKHCPWHEELTGNLSEEEEKRRIEALESSSSYREAGRKVGVAGPTMAAWARRNWDGYERQHSAVDEAALRHLRVSVVEAMESLRDGELSDVETELRWMAEVLNVDEQLPEG